jgi:hypothetical protein
LIPAARRRPDLETDRPDLETDQDRPRGSWEILDALSVDTRPTAGTEAPDGTEPQPRHKRPFADEQQTVEPAAGDDVQLADDRLALRRLGVPTAWTRRFKGGDRFAGVIRMLDRLPTLDLDPDTRIVAVVGPASSVTMEAHRTALDLATDDRPRAVVVVPARQGQARRSAVARAQRLAGGVVAIATESYDDVESVLDTLQAVGAGAVIAVVEAGRDLGATQAWLEALDDVAALAIHGAGAVSDPAAVLQLDLPVVRLDGIPIDRVTWTALLCARLDPEPRL